ncbi:MAG TPA: hypothetical protein VFY44_10830, partial [Thermoleophilaceae bacterium]|nr:hypothetical protein [Thermoleophilaceae bacterium]
NVNRMCAGVLQVVGGAVELVLDGRPRRVAAGQYAEVPRDVPWRAVVEADAHVLWFGAPAGIESLVGMLGHPPLDDDDAAALLAAAGVSRVRASW